MQPKKTLTWKIRAGLGIAAGAAIIATAAITGTAMAQTATTAAPATAAGVDCQGPHHWGGHGGDRQANMLKHLDKLKADLKLQPNQEGAWQAYTAKLQEQGAKMKALHQQAGADAKTLTLPERLDQRTAFMKQRQADMEETNAALKALYASLTPEQRAIMDQRFSRGKGHHA